MKNLNNTNKFLFKITGELDDSEESIIAKCKVRGNGKGIIFGVLSSIVRMSFENHLSRKTLEHLFKTTCDEYYKKGEK